MGSAAVREWEDGGHLVDVAGDQVFVRDVPAVTDVGNDPLLVLHGFPSCSFDYRGVLPELSAERRVVFLDFLGCGLSAKPDRRYGMRMQADVVEAVVAS